MPLKMDALDDLAKELGITVANLQLKARAKGIRIVNKKGKWYIAPDQASRLRSEVQRQVRTDPNAPAPTPPTAKPATPAATKPPAQPAKPPAKSPPPVTQQPKRAPLPLQLPPPPKDTK